MKITYFVQQPKEFLGLINDIVYFFFVFIDEINGDLEKEEEVVLNFTVHDSNV